VDDSDDLGIALPLIIRWPDDMRRPFVGLVQDLGSCPYWTKYRRFLEANAFPFRLIDIHRRGWLEDIEGIDMLVWRPRSAPFELEEARRKIFYMTEFLDLRTYPNLRSVMLYEDKVQQAWVFRSLGLATPSTLASFSLSDTLENMGGLGKDLVWKVATCAGSFGVERMSVRQARRAARRAFSARGRRTYWPYANQRGYVYLQTLERDLRTDMRVTVVGPLLFGFYRDAPTGDFRASGMGRERKEAIPEAALEDAWRAAHELNVGPLAVDFIVDRDLKTHKAIELTAFTGLLTQDQLQVDGRCGVYVRRSQGRFDFVERSHWLHELALAQAIGSAYGLDTDRLLLEAVLKEATAQAD
jgi:hypothetical protein